MLECSQNYWNARNPGSAQLVPKFIQGRERGKCAQMLLSAWRISVGLWQTRWMFSFKCTTSYLTYFPWMSGLNRLKDWNILSHKHFWFTDLFVSCPDPFSKKDSCFEHPHLYTKQAVQACFPCHQVLLHVTRLVCTACRALHSPWGSSELWALLNKQNLLKQAKLPLGCLSSLILAVEHLRHLKRTWMFSLQSFTVFYWHKENWI